MGAAIFHTAAKGADLGSAFMAAVAEARAEHGNEGYTGSIAEKPSAEMFPLPEGVTVHEFFAALENAGAYWASGALQPGARPSWAAEYLYWDAAVAIFDDKWASAVAVASDTTAGMWHFGGWASA